MEETRRTKVCIYARVSTSAQDYDHKKMNRVLNLIYQQTNELRGYKKRNKTDENSSVLFSAQDSI